MDIASRPLSLSGSASLSTPLMYDGSLFTQCLYFFHFNLPVQIDTFLLLLDLTRKFSNRLWDPLFLTAGVWGCLSNLPEDFLQNQGFCITEVSLPSLDLDLVTFPAIGLHIWSLCFASSQYQMWEPSTCLISPNLHSDFIQKLCITLRISTFVALSISWVKTRNLPCELSWYCLQSPR